MTACLAAIAFASLAAGLAAFLLGRRRLSPEMRDRLAEREDANGRALLRMAAEIDAHAADLRRMGLSVGNQRDWVVLCRRIAAEHLACINALLVDPETGRSLIGFERGRERP